LTRIYKDLKDLQGFTGIYKDLQIFRKIGNDLQGLERIEKD